MTTLVVDTSILAAWFLPDELDPIAAAVLKELDAGATILLARHTEIEFLNILRTARKRKHISNAECFDMIGSYSLLALSSSTEAAEPARLWELMEKHDLTSYDAEYLRLAKERSARLATLDLQLVRSARREHLLFEV